MRPGAEQMASADCATVGIHMRGIVGRAELPQHRQALRGKGLVELDHLHLAELEAGLSSTRRDAGAGPMPMMRGSTPTVAMPTTRARGLGLARRHRLAGQQQCHRAVISREALPAVTLPSARTTP